MCIKSSSFVAVAGLTVLAGLLAQTTTLRAQDDAAGVARIDVLGSGEPTPAPPSVVDSGPVVTGSECNGDCQGDCNGDYCGGRLWDSNGCHISQFRRRNELCAARVCQNIHDKLSYFHPTGSGGAGSPPFGHYHRTYPANPYYADDRDDDVYAAQGYGVPMAVPLAPNVRHTYNYGWGIPSSRLTPVSRPLPFNPTVYAPAPY
jgi:hypothetical protein